VVVYIVSFINILYLILTLHLFENNMARGSISSSTWYALPKATLESCKVSFSLL